MAFTAIGSSLLGFLVMSLILKNSQKYFVEQQKRLAELDGVTDSFVTYGIPSDYSTETFFDKKKKREFLKEDGYDKAEIDDIISNDAESDGTYANHIQILGVEEYALSKIDVLEGDISKIMEEGYIAVNINDEFRLGDKILRQMSIGVQIQRHILGGIVPAVGVKHRLRLLGLGGLGGRLLGLGECGRTHIRNRVACVTDRGINTRLAAQTGYADECGELFGIYLAFVFQIQITGFARSEKIVVLEGGT